MVQRFRYRRSSARLAEAFNDGKSSVSVRQMSSRFMRSYCCLIQLPVPFGQGWSAQSAGP
jgi:hypothetical protein